MSGPIHPARLRRAVAAACAALLFVALAQGTAAGTDPPSPTTTPSSPTPSSATPPSSPSASGDTGLGGLDPRITAIMRKPEYRNAQWGLLQTDPDTGRVVHSLFPEQFFIPGSTANCSASRARGRRSAPTTAS